MRTTSEMIATSILFLLFFGVPTQLSGDDLIALTRSLEGPWQLPGKLTVVSEPADQHVFLDGAEIGRTPLWLKQVKPGPHGLRVMRSETDVVVEPGKTLTLSYFKGTFIVVQEKKQAGKELAPAPEKLAKDRKQIIPLEEQKPTDLTPWEQFLNKTSPNF